jgi:MFS family permease
LARIRPKILFQIGIFCNGVIFFIMGFVESLPLLLTLRLMQGALGGVSTIGLVLIAASAPKDKLPKYLSLFQNSMTAGQLIGPPLGAYAVALLGYHSPFIIALVVVFLSLVYCHSHVRNIPVQPKSPRRGKPLTGGILWGWGLTIVGTMHLMFLPSILPHILEGFQVTEQAAITTAGTIMMAYMATAIVGNYLPCQPCFQVEPGPSHHHRLPVGRGTAGPALFQHRRLQLHLDPRAPDGHDRGRYSSCHLNLCR